MRTAATALDPRRNLLSSLALGLVLAFAGTRLPASAQAAFGGKQGRIEPPRQLAHGPDQVSTGPDVDALRQMFERAWHPNCSAPGAENVQLGVRIRLKPDGDTEDLSIENPHPETPVWIAAAIRVAMAARAAPYRDLPPAQLKALVYRGNIYFRIDQGTVCRQ